MSEKKLKVTSLDEVKRRAEGEVVPLPGWGADPFAEGETFNVKMRRPSLLGLVLAGKIPNTLLTTAKALFDGKNVMEGDGDAFRQVAEVIDAMLDASFVEPRFEDVKEYLTDEQRTAAFAYIQAGMRGLERFRLQRQLLEADEHSGG